MESFHSSQHERGRTHTQGPTDSNRGPLVSEAIALPAEPATTTVSAQVLRQFRQNLPVVAKWLDYFSTVDLFTTTKTLNLPSSITKMPNQIQNKP